MEDERIIELYFSRDSKALAATSEKYGRYCGAIARNILPSDEDAEECVNDAYMSVWNSIPPQRPGSLKAYLGRITRNLALNMYRGMTSARRGGGTVESVLEELEEIVSGGESAEDEVLRREAVRTVNDYLSRLSPRRRNIFVRRYWYADSVRDIARRFGMTEGAVTMVLTRMRKKLREELEKGGFEI